jgi:pimeloyl-ACP methyl ester carboxylesterase
VLLKRFPCVRKGMMLGLAGCATVLLSLIIPSTSGATSAGHNKFSAHVVSQYQSDAKPTIVLVHGAWADSSSWDRVIQRLQSDGYTVMAEPNPLRGLANDTTYLEDFLQSIKGPIILVGHSYGGMVITNAATGNPNVKALVYDDAYIPAQGETVFQLTAAQPGSCLTNPDPTKVFNFATYPGAASGDFDLYVKPTVFTSCFANDLSPEQAAVAAAVQRPLPFSAGSDPSGPPAWTTIPSWDVVGTIDHVIPVAEQLFMAHRAGAHITEVHAGHLSMISQPQIVTDVILDAARASS